MPGRRNPPTPPTDAEIDKAASTLADAIRPLVDELRALHAQAVALHTPEVDAIIRSRSREKRRIERALDDILSISGDDAGLALFKRLCRYYWDIDPHATAEYVYAYRDMFGEEADNPPPDKAEVASTRG